MAGQGSRLVENGTRGAAQALSIATRDAVSATTSQRIGILMSATLPASLAQYKLREQHRELETHGDEVTALVPGNDQVYDPGRTKPSQDPPEIRYARYAG